MEEETLKSMAFENGNDNDFEDKRKGEEELTEGKQKKTNELKSMKQKKLREEQEAEGRRKIKAKEDELAKASFRYGEINRHIFNGFEETVSPDDEKVTYSVSYFPLPTMVASLYMCRKNEEIYLESVNKNYELALFPPMLKEGVKYKDDFIHMSRVCLSVRVRRVVLQEEINNIEVESKKFDELIEICEEKKMYQYNRLMMLEGELDFIMATDPSRPCNRMNSLLLVLTSKLHINVYKCTYLRECEYLSIFVFSSYI